MIQKKDSLSLSGLLTVFFCVLFPCTLPAAGKTLFQKTADPYKDSMTGKVFPARIGSFQKSMVRVFPNSVMGTRITYRLQNGEGCADLYIYALEENPSGRIAPEEFALHDRQMREEFAKNLKSGKGITQVEALPGDSHYRFQVAGKTFHAKLRIFPWEKFILKVHLTLPASGCETESFRFLDALQKLLTAEKDISSKSPRNNRKVSHHGK